jgi:hypothetical protein
MSFHKQRTRETAAPSIGTVSGLIDFGEKVRNVRAYQREGEAARSFGQSSSEPYGHELGRRQGLQLRVAATLRITRDVLAVGR